MDITTVFIAMSIPSAITGFCFWMIERKIEKREKEREKKDEARVDNEFLLLKSVGAAIALGEATAMALKNGKANGETEVALEYARKVKHEQKEFLNRQGLQNIY